MSDAGVVEEPIAHLAAADQVRQRRQGFLDVRLRVEAVDLLQVDVVALQPLRRARGGTTLWMQATPSNIGVLFAVSESAKPRQQITTSEGTHHDQ